MEAVSDPRLEAAFVKVDEALVELRGVGVVPTDARDAIRVVRRLEHVSRVVYGLQAGLVGEIDRRGLHRADGHKSVRAMVGWAADLSPGDATRRARAAKVLRDMPHVAAAVAAGQVSVSTLDRIGRTLANGRVRDRLIEADGHLAVVAAALPYRPFDVYLSNWERLADEDGTRDRAERTHANRDFTMRRNLDGSYRIEGGCGAMQGRVAADVFEVFAKAEFEADWAEARARLGDEATVEDLARTDAQRRMDAIEAIFSAAAAAHLARTGHQIVTDLIIDHATLDRYAKTFTGEPLDPDPRLQSWWQDLAAKIAAHDQDDDESHVEVWAEPDDDPTDTETDTEDPVPMTGFRCSDVDGNPIDPTEATGYALLHSHIRRVVLGADGVALDAGRLRRVFTGPQHTAVLLSSTTCCWPGCNAPASTCQADHLLPWAHPEQGRTDPGNGAPTCGKHNRFRNHGFTVHRDDDGTLHVHRPDGTRIA